MQMYTDCTFVPLRVKYSETRTIFCVLKNKTQKKVFKLFCLLTLFLKLIHKQHIIYTKKGLVII